MKLNYFNFWQCITCQIIFWCSKITSESIHGSCHILNEATKRSEFKSSKCWYLFLGSQRECSHQYLPIISAAPRGKKTLKWCKLTKLIQGRPSGSFGGCRDCNEQQEWVQREISTHADGRALWVSKPTFSSFYFDHKTRQDKTSKVEIFPDEIKINSPDEPKRARIIAFSVWGILRSYTVGFCLCLCLCHRLCHCLFVRPTLQIYCFLCNTLLGLNSHIFWSKIVQDPFSGGLRVLVSLSTWRRGVTRRWFDAKVFLCRVKQYFTH